jgi:hypothetical protein
MVFSGYVLILVLWGALGFTALLSGVSAVSSLAKKLDRTAAPAVRTAERDDALAA